MQYRKMVISVGAFVVLTTLLLISTAFYVIDKKGIFKPKFEFKLVTKDGNGLSEGMPVVYSGFEIGSVVNLELTKEGEVVMHIEIPSYQHKWIHEDSVFVLDKPLIGTPSIIVNTANLSSDLLKGNDSRDIVTKDGINELVAKVQPLLDEVQGVVTNVNKMTKDESDINKILYNVEVITAKVAKIEALSTIDETLLEVKSMVKRLKYQISDPKVGIVAKANAQLLGEHNSSMSMINATIADVQAKVKSLDATVAQVNKMSKSMGTMTDDVMFTVKKTDILIDKVDAMVSDTPTDVIQLP